MKKTIAVFLLAWVLALGACTDDPNSIIGTWTVDKVHVGFDESHDRPELVKQLGMMEQQNVIVISPDSTLTFTTLNEKHQGKMSLDSDGILSLDGMHFGTWKNGEIVTQTDSPLGKIVIIYRKAD